MCTVLLMCRSEHFTTFLLLPLAFIFFLLLGYSPYEVLSALDGAVDIHGPSIAKTSDDVHSTL